MEILWTMLVVLSIAGDGSGHIVTERFGPYEDRKTCERSAINFEEELLTAQSYVSVEAYCIPEKKAEGKAK